MTIEVLFPEVCGLFGDAYNAKYLQLALPDAEFLFTPLTATPYFAENDPDMLLLGAMTERTQRRVIEKLLPLKDRLIALADKGVPMLFTGNACDLFAKHIRYVTEEIEVDGLGLFDLEAKIDLFNRYDSRFLGACGDITVVGFRSQFGFLYGDNSQFAFLTCQRGSGIHPGSKLEGMRRNNLICTQLLGPILPLNPQFTEYFIGLTGRTVTAPFREAAMAAYRQRIIEFSDPKTVMN